MREIKFRAWDRKMVEMEYQDNDTSWGAFWDSVHPDSEKILMQYTGLKDKNGKEIYEGDLIRNESLRICEVIFMSGAFDAKPVNVPIKSDAVGFKLEAWRYRIEVIGNIYEHPELRKDA